MCRFVEKNKKYKRCEVHHIFRWVDFIQYRYTVEKACLLCYKHHREVNGIEHYYIKFLLELVAKSEAEYILKQV